MACDCGSCVDCQSLYSIPTYDDTAILASLAANSAQLITNATAIVNLTNATTVLISQVASLEAKRSRILLNEHIPSSTTGTAEEDLISYNLPFDTLSEDGDKLIIKGAFFTNNPFTTNAKNARVYIDTQQIFAANLEGQIDALDVETSFFQIDLSRNSTTLMYQFSRGEFGTTGGSINSLDLLTHGSTTVPNLSNAGNFPLVIKMTGEATVAPETITALYMTIDLIKV